MAYKNFSIRIEEEMLNKLRNIAHREVRSVNRQIMIMIREGIRSYEEKQGKK